MGHNLCPGWVTRAPGQVPAQLSLGGLSGCACWGRGLLPTWPVTEG